MAKRESQNAPMKKQVGVNCPKCFKYFLATPDDKGVIKTKCQRCGAKVEEKVEK